MFEATDPLGLNGIPALRPRAGGEWKATDILERGAERVQRELGKEPETQAKLLDTIGGVLCTLGLTAKARPLLERALALRRRLLPRDHADLAATLHNLAFLHHQNGDYTAASRLYREALAIRQKHARTDSAALSATMLNLAWLLLDLEEFPAADRLFKETIALRAYDDRAVAIARAGLVASYVTQGKFAEALPLYLQAMATLRKIEGPGGLAESVSLLQAGIIGRNLPSLGALLGLKDQTAVEHSFERSLALARKALGNHHAYVALVLHELAFTLAQHGKFAEAERYFADCYRIAREYGLYHPKVTILLGNYCAVLKRRGKRAQARRLLDEALAARRPRYPANHRGIADLLVIRAAVLTDPGSSSRRQELHAALAMYCKAAAVPGRFASICVQLLTDGLPAPDNYAVACELARAAGRAKAEGAREQFGDLAMVALGKARQKGFADARRLGQDEDVAALRGRKDFQKLLAELQGASGRQWR
jgi:tetratricopeptide (TPR) repeat protein